MSWQDGALGDLLIFQRGHDLPDYERKPGEVPVVGSAGVNGYHNVEKAPAPCVTIGRSGASIGKPFYLNGAFWPHNACLYVKDFKGNNPKFLFYLLGRMGLDQFNSGAAQPSLNRNFLYGAKVRYPERTEQDRIVAVLSAYDNLIENNRRRIALLEDAARQNYKEWFVRFRFPGHEDVKVIDGVPEGWEWKALGDVAELVMGQSPKSQFYNEYGNGLPFHQGVSDYGFRFVAHRTYSTAITKLAEPNDILVSVRAPVGRINITLERIVLGRGLSAVRSKSGNQSFLLYALKEHFYAEDIIGTGAIYAATNKKELEAQSLLIPPEHLITNFEYASLSIDRQIANLSKSVEHLTKARDLLLPKLMSGTLTV